MGIVDGTLHYIAPETNPPTIPMSMALNHIHRSRNSLNREAGEMIIVVVECRTIRTTHPNDDMNTTEKLEILNMSNENTVTAISGTKTEDVEVDIVTQEKVMDPMTWSTEMRKRATIRPILGTNGIKAVTNPRDRVWVNLHIPVLITVRAAAVTSWGMRNVISNRISDETDILTEDGVIVMIVTAEDGVMPMHKDEDEDTDNSEKCRR